MNGSPLVSIVVPTYNRAEYLREAVESVFAQTYQHWELIVVDDGSTDDTRAYLDLLEDPRVRVLLQDHSGNPARARNLGLAEARGEYVAFLDSDDVWRPGKLERQLNVLRGYRECGWSYTGFSVENLRGSRVGSYIERRPQPSGWIQEAIILGRALIPTPTVLARRDLLQSVGGFNEDLVYSQDYDLWIRLSEQSQVAHGAGELAVIRQHAENRHTRLLAFPHVKRLLEDAESRARAGRIRRACRTMWVRAHLQVADSLGWNGRHAEARRAVLDCWRSGFWRPVWWWTLTKAILRPAIRSA